MMTEQGSEQWHRDRAGRITASRFADALAMREVTVERATKTREKVTKLVSSEGRNTYMRELVAEILSGQPNHEISSKSLQWGKDLEVYAREAYEVDKGGVVVQSPFVVHSRYDYIGASPDGLVDRDGGIEMKCPLSEQVHIKTWLDGIPPEHIPQVQGNMFVTGRQWWDFISYHPRQAEPFRLYVQRIPRDNDYINNILEPGLLQFWAELQAMLNQLRRKAA